MTEPVQITQRAVSEIQYILKKKGIPKGYGLRVGVAGARGCMGVKLILGFDKEKPEDRTFEISGLKVHIQKPEMMFLIGKTVDFYEGSDARGFIFLDNESEKS